MDYNERMNKYMKERWSKRRLQAVEFLGGCCKQCGSTESLEFDHVDPSTKIMTIARASARSETFFWEEVKKCQLLCTDCHKQKTSIDIGVPHGGGKSGKRNCPCAPCKARKAEYMRDYKKVSY
jgi:5-methylcytosine-specific restriction endonuclease McrA